MAQDLYFSSSAAATTLSSGVSNSATSITVGSITGLPLSYPYLLILDPDTASEEVVLVTAGGGTTLTVTRGYDSTTGLSHSAGAVVRHGVSAKAFNDLYALKDVAATLTGSQTLTNKSIDGDVNTLTDIPVSAIKQAAWTSFTPTVSGFTFSGTPYARYLRIGNRVEVVVAGVVATSTGTATFTLPVTAVTSTAERIVGRLYNVLASDTTKKLSGSVALTASSGTATAFFSDGDTTSPGAAFPSTLLHASDHLSFVLSYEAA